MKDKVIELAHKLDLIDSSDMVYDDLNIDDLERFYNIVRAEYRKEIGEPVAYGKIDEDGDIRECRSWKGGEYLCPLFAIYKLPKEPT